MLDFEEVIAYVQGALLHLYPEAVPPDPEHPWRQPLVVRTLAMQQIPTDDPVAFAGVIPEGGESPSPAPERYVTVNPGPFAPTGWHPEVQIGGTPAAPMYHYSQEYVGVYRIMFFGDESIKAASLFNAFGTTPRSAEITDKFTLKEASYSTPAMETVSEAVQERAQVDLYLGWRYTWAQAARVYVPAPTVEVDAGPAGPGPGEGEEFRFRFGE